MSNPPHSSTDTSRTNEYTVLSDYSPIESLLEIKRSEFIGHVIRVETESEARAYIESLRKQYHNTRHVCSAFVLGPDRDVQRSSDDGEPAGTAGIPMLQALLSWRTRGETDEVADLSDICAIVVRYFGGIKLGAGGLVRAYTDAVVQVLDKGKLIPRRRLRVGEVTLPHAEAGKFENDVRNHGVTVLGTEYLPQHAVVSLGVFDDPSRLTETEDLLAQLTAGSAGVRWSETSWVDVQG